ncbi:MAG: hypothetical protein ACO3CQ_00350 [Candidatus Nanopelagicaceae bacterium]
MLSHIAQDLYESYLTEMEPQLGKKEDGGGEAKGGAPALGDQSAKRIRQAVYDIRYRARREEIGIDQAYSQYMSHTSMPANEKAAVREKLGLGASGGPVKEEAEAGKHYLRVDPRSRKTGEKPYVKKFDPSSEKDRKKRHGLQQKGIVTTVTKHGSPYDGAGEKYEKKYGPATGKNTVGDKDKDGTVEPDGHEYAGVKDNAIKKATAKKGTKKESFSSWREEIREVVEKINDIQQKEIKEKSVNNYKDKTVVINPEIKSEEIAYSLGGELVESVDLGENYIEEVADFATEYFYAEGLNENGIDILIEDMGVDEFVDYLFDLDEARRSGRIEPVTKTGKDVGSLKGGAKTAAIKRLRGEKEKRREAEASASSSKPSGMTAALKSQSEKAKVSSGLKKAKTEKKVENAKASQAPASNKSSEGTKKEVKKGILGAIKDRAARDTELLKKSWKTARDAGKSAEKKVASAAGTAAGAVHGAAKAVHRAGQEFGKSETGQKVKKGLAKTAVAAAGAAGAGLGAKASGKTNAQAAGRAVGTFVRRMREDYELWIDELISEGYDVWEYSEDYLIETYLPEDLDEGIGSALRGLLTPKPSERQQLAKQRMDAHRAAMASGKSGDSPYSPQRKKPSAPIKKPNTPERDPWSGNAETDKAWAKGGSAASSPRAYKREEFEEWMEALLEEIQIDENVAFLVFESNFMAEEMFLNEAKNKEGKEQGADGKACWKGYRYAGTKNGKDECVKSEEVDLEEKAPPGAKFERMVKHIKKNYAKKGGLSDKEKSIAYATAWKAKNK